eukprot:SAG31_NODE_632_length_13389_cov_4.818360_5_plen_97_part_00
MSSDDYPTMVEQPVVQTHPSKFVVNGFAAEVQHLPCQCLTNLWVKVSVCVRNVRKANSSFVLKDIKTSASNCFAVQRIKKIVGVDDIAPGCIYDDD